MNFEKAREVIDDGYYRDTGVHEASNYVDAHKYYQEVAELMSLESQKEVLQKVIDKFDVFINEVTQMQIDTFTPGAYEGFEGQKMGAMSMKAWVQQELEKL